jgi:hypothetical protein
MTGRLAFTKQLLILDYQITYAQHLEKKKVWWIYCWLHPLSRIQPTKKNQRHPLFSPSVSRAKILKMVVMNAGGNERRISKIHSEV